MTSGTPHTIERLNAITQAFDHQIIGVVDQPANQIAWQVIVEDHGIPVLLIPFE